MAAADQTELHLLDNPVRVTEQTWAVGTQPMVSIVCVTYNHAQFIKECLDGFLMQETTFPIEIVVHDDASTDFTRAILETYAANHPALFHLILQHDNKLSQNIRPTPIAISATKGRYVAFCDGDDYWTSPNKLEFQVRYLNARPEVNLCFHRAGILAMEGTVLGIQVLPQFELKPSYSVEELMQHNFIPTSSVLIRREAVAATPEWFQYMAMNDWPRWVLACESSPAGALEDIMAVYRVHKAGVWQGMSREVQLMADLDFYSVMSNFAPPRVSAIAKGEKQRLVARLLEGSDCHAKLNRITNHAVLGRMLRLWRRYINPAFPV